MIIKDEEDYKKEDYNKLIKRKIIEWFIYIGCILSVVVYMRVYMWIFADKITFFYEPLLYLTASSVLWMPVVVAIFDRKYYNKWYLLVRSLIYMFAWKIVSIFVGIVHDQFFPPDPIVDLYVFATIYSILLIIPILELIYLVVRKRSKKK